MQWMIVMSFSTTSSFTSTQFACAILIDHPLSERLYTRQIITWGGSSYKNAFHRVPACVCEGMSACVHIFSSCTYSFFLRAIHARTPPTLVTVGESHLHYLSPYSCMTRGPGCWMSHVSAKGRRTIFDDREGARNHAVDRLHS